MKRLINFFNYKYAGVACILIAIINRSINLLFFSYTGRDKMVVLLQSKSFLEGKGFSVPQYFINQLDNPVYDYTQLWPPGYSLFIAPFLKIFNYNIYWATSMFDIVVGIALIFTVRKICKQIGLPIIATNIMTLIAGCFEYPFTNQSMPTDTVSLLFVLLGISFSLKVIAAKAFSLKQICVAAFLLFLPSLFRYAYPPVSISIAGMIFLYGWVMKDKLLLKKGYWLSALVALLIVTLFISLKFSTGQAGYITETERGYFTENLVHWYPAIPNSFIDLPFFTMQVLRLTGISLSNQYLVLEAINIILVLVLTVLFFHFLIIKKTFREINSFKWLLLWAWVCSALIFFSLGWLSFTNQVQRGYIGNWNYVYEARYFGLVMLFLQIIYLGWVFLNPSWQKSWWQKTIIIFCAFLLFVEVVHGIYFNTKMALNFRENKAKIYREQDYNYFLCLLPKLEKEYPGYEILATASNDDFYACAAAYFGKKGIFDCASLKTSLPKVKIKSLLLVILYDTDIKDYQNIVANPNAREIKEVDYTNFFLVELFP